MGDWGDCPFRSKGEGAGEELMEGGPGRGATFGMCIKCIYKMFFYCVNMKGYVDF